MIKNFKILFLMASLTGFACSAQNETTDLNCKRNYASLAIFTSGLLAGSRLMKNSTPTHYRLPIKLFLLAGTLYAFFKSSRCMLNSAATWGFKSLNNNPRVKQEIADFTNEAARAFNEKDKELSQGKK